MARKSSFSEGQLTDISFYILSSLYEERHGYLIMETIKKLTDGKIIIGPGSVYTTLKKMVDYGYISQVTSNDKHRISYIISPAGKEALENDIKRKEEMIIYANKATTCEEVN